jgi:signal peptidase I
MKFKLNDRVYWSIFNLTGTVTNVLSDIVYIKWDKGNHTISYNAFECRNIEVILPVLLIGDRVALKNSSNKGVIISHYDYNSLFVQWDGSSEYVCVSVKDLTRDNSNVATDNKLKVTKEADITPEFKVGDRVVNNYSSYKGVITRIDKYVKYPCFTTYFKWDDGDEILPTEKGQFMHNEFTIKWDNINHLLSYADTVNFHLDTDQVLATKEADTPVFKVGDRIAHKKSSNKGVIISNYRTILLAVQWDGSSEYFYISPKDLTLDNSIVATNDKLKVTLEVDITLNVKDELFNVAEQMVSILVKYKDYDSAKQLLECIELLNNLTNTK